MKWPTTAAADIARAEELVEQALATSPRSPLAHFAKGQMLRAQNRPEEAIPEYEMVIASNRNWVGRIQRISAGASSTPGRSRRRSHSSEQAIRLSPRDPYIGNWYSRIGIGHLLQSRIDEAIVWFEKARSANPEHPRPHGCLAAAYGLKGWTERAAAELAEARRLSADGRYSSIARLKAAGHWGVPKWRPVRGDLFRRPAPGGNAGGGTQVPLRRQEWPNLRRDMADLAAIGSGR